MGNIPEFGAKFANLGQNAQIFTQTVVTFKTCIMPCVAAITFDVYIAKLQINYVLVRWNKHDGITS